MRSRLTIDSELPIIDNDSDLPIIDNDRILSSLGDFGLLLDFASYVHRGHANDNLGFAEDFEEILATCRNPPPAKNSEDPQNQVRISHVVLSVTTFNNFEP